MGTTRRSLAGAGIQTSGLAFGGLNGSPTSNATEEYDGSAWTAGGNLNNGRRYLAGAGTQTAGLAYGGGTATVITNATEEYDGASWTAGGNLSGVVRVFPGSAGTQTAGLGFGGSTNFTFDGSNVQIGSQGDLRLGDSDNSNYVALQAPATIASNYTLTLPSTTGTANQVIQTDGSGNLSFATVSGGAAWQAVKTGNFNVTAKEGYFVDTTSTTITATLPSSPTIGDFVSFIDYAGTFDTNNLTVARNGKPIQGSATDLTVATERAGFTLVFVDNTQGWLLQNN